ncbi:Ribose operon repressor [Carnimonas sp. R-84981]|uniref:LacI family DNA-binding transcriptional regulator n=1 Tax=Carnimonas bestiolae TaxID=3402172 RepID=UPI003EDC3742
MKGKASQADVARLAGVSVTTVNLVLNKRGSARISTATAERVVAAAQQLGYSTDAIGRMLRTGESRSLGFISNSVATTRYASAMISGVLEAAERQGYMVLIAEAESHQLQRTVDSLLERRVDGLLFGFMQARRVDIPDLKQQRAVLINGVSDGLPSLLPDEYAAGVSAIECLLAHRHQRIGVIGRSNKASDPYYSVTIESRFAGIDDALRDAGLCAAGEVHGDEWEPSLGYQGTLELLDSAGDITALVVANDRIAFGAYRALFERGLRVPDDVSVVSFDDEPLAEYLYPALTTLQLPYHQMGKLAVDKLLDAGCSLGNAACERVAMPLVQRQSVRQV